MSEFINGFKRSHDCGSLRASDVGQHVRLVGWVQDYRNMGGFLFITLRDRYGLTQVKFSDDRCELLKEGQEIRSEWVIGVGGLVVSRGENANKNLKTGEIEVEVDELRIFNRSATPPFAIHNEVDAGESVRLKYRYLDMRRSVLAKNILTRSQIVRIVRDVLESRGFLDMETPFLTRSTPEGARDYLVPSRLYHGQCYALPQSPQLFKQLLMVAGFDRYYQIARCFRDEDLRLDRQPEFTQIDMEMSFIEREDIFEVCEALISRLFKEVLGIELEGAFRRMSWLEAMERYGLDAPDIRFGMELQDVCEILKDSSFKVFSQALEAGGSVKALVVPASVVMSRKVIGELEEIAKSYGAKGLAWTKIVGDGVDGGIGKFLSAEEVKGLLALEGVEEGGTLLFVSDSLGTVRRALGRVRKAIAEQNGWVRKDIRSAEDVGLVWVIDFPMFEKNEEDGGWSAMHHPFTAPLSEDLGYFESGDLSQMKAQAYDLVLNGIELGGGSIRIHSMDIQKKVFAALGIGEVEAREKFGFLLDALQYGAPPHGGLAFGLDRIVMLLTGAESLRDVIAFPKTNKAMDLMCEAPGVVDASQLEVLGLQVIGEKL